jgi:hypothetical protein
MLLPLVLLVNSAMCANILVIFDNPMFSHEITLRGVLQKLTENGHKLTVFSTFLKLSENSNITHHTFKRTGLGINKLFLTSDDLSLFAIFRLQTQTVQNISTHHVRHPELRKIIDERPKFDLMIIECALSPLISLGHHLDCPVVYVFASFIPPVFLDIVRGNHMHAAVHRAIDVSNGIDGQLSVVARLQSFFEDTFLGKEVVKFVCRVGERVMSEARVEYYFFEKALARVELMIGFTKVMRNFGRIQPQLPYDVLNMHSTHLLNLMDTQEFDEQLWQFLEDSSKPAILIAFGSIVRLDLLKINLTEIIVAAIEELSDDFVFIWSVKDIEVVHENLFKAPWLPIIDILKHPRVKIFINHGGTRSIEESISCDVPMITIPIFLDHFINSMFVERGGIARRILLNSLSDHMVLVNMIREVAKNEEIFKSIKLVNALNHDEFEAGTHEVVWHIEHVMKFKSSSRYVGHKFSLYQRLHLDLISVILIVFYFFKRLNKFIK